MVKAFNIPDTVTLADLAPGNWPWEPAQLLLVGSGYFKSHIVEKQTGREPRQASGGQKLLWVSEICCIMKGFCCVRFF